MQSASIWGYDGSSAWAKWKWSGIGFPIDDKGLQLRFSLHCDPDLPGTYTLNIHYYVEIMYRSPAGGMYPAASKDVYQTIEYLFGDQPASGIEITRRSGTLSGTGATYTFSASSLSGAYTVVMVGNEEYPADFDLYAKWNSPPTTTSYDARGFSGSSLEYFTLPYGAGTLYVMVRSWRGSGHWICNVLTGAQSVSGGRKYGSLSGSGATYTYSLSGTGRAWVYVAGPDSGDYDLYIKWNSPPTTTSYDARGFSAYSQEICTATGSGTLYYMVRSWRGSGQYTALALIF